MKYLGWRRRVALMPFHRLLAVRLTPIIRPVDLVAAG